MDLQTSPIEGTSSDKHDILDQLARKPLDADELQGRKKRLQPLDLIKEVNFKVMHKPLLEFEEAFAYNKRKFKRESKGPPPGFLPPPGHPMHMNIPPQGFLSNRMPAPPIHDRLGRPSYWRRNTLKRESEDDVFDSDADFGDDELDNEEEGRPSKDRHKVVREGTSWDEYDVYKPVGSLTSNDAIYGSENDRIFEDVEHMRELDDTVTLEIKAFNSETCTVKAKLFERVEDIIEKAIKILHVPKDKYTLVDDGTELGDTLQVCYIAIRKGSTFNLIPDTTSGSNVIPEEILKMDKNSIELYKRALSEGTEPVYNIRVMIVGHYGVGKTTLRKRLFGEDVEIGKRESTDGIDVHVKRCRVPLQTGQWNMLDRGQKKEMASHRLIKLLKKSDTTCRTAEIKMVENEVAKLRSDTNLLSGENKQLSNDSESHATRSFVTEVEPPVTKKDVPNVEIFKVDIGPNDFATEETKSAEEKPKKAETGNPKDKNVVTHLEKLIKDVEKHHVINAESKTAYLSVWDFAGQFAFYATHQVFLSRRAVYLIVTDISKNADDAVNDKCYVDSKGASRLKISDFVDFWLNSIHEYCSSPDDRGPPVILVGTFADKLNAETKDHIVKKFFCKLRRALANKKTFCHLIKEDFAVDNSVEDSNVERLKKQILETASKQNYWGEQIPAKWISLESVTLKDNSPKVLRKDELRDLNSTLPVPIETEEELELFLKFHHESGDILFFSDDKLQDSIILDPQWLIDAFKSLITAEEFCNKEQAILQKWIQFNESAILTDEFVETIWGRKEYSGFHEHKELLLNFLERLGIIAKPIQHSNSDEVADYYFAPCVLKTSPPKKLLECSNSENQRSTSILCFKTPSGFLPTAVFNRLLAACIHKWPLSKRKGKPTIFCGCGIFDLQDNHTLYIYFYDNVIQIWLTKLSTSDKEPDRHLCLEIKSFVLDLLQNRFGMTSSIDVYVKCQTADLRSGEDDYAIDEIARKSEVVCSRRNKQRAVLVQDLLKYWQEDSIPEISIDMSREVTERDLIKISQAIGSEWKFLGAALGITEVEMEHIDCDNKATPMKIFSMLTKWRRENDATVNTLYNAIQNCRPAVTFDMKVIERVFAQRN